MVRKLEVNGKEVCNQAKINDEIKIFLEEVFKCYKCKSFTNLSSIVNPTDLPCLANEQTDLSEIELREKELFNALKSIPNIETSGNEGLSKDFYEAFQNELTDPLLKSFYHAKM